MYKGDGANNVNRAIQEILKPLHERGVHAVIAGGFMRDNALGRPWRDIDLYVPQGFYRESCTFLYGFAPNADSMWLKGDAEYDHQSIFQQVERETELMDDAVVNLIETTLIRVTPASVIEHFNLGISMAATDGFNGLLHTRFLRDVADKKITLYRPDWGYEKSLKKWVKLQEKYTGWDLRLPEEGW